MAAGIRTSTTTDWLLNAGIARHLIEQLLVGRRGFLRPTSIRESVPSRLARTQNPWNAKILTHKFTRRERFLQSERLGSPRVESKSLIIRVCLLSRQRSRVRVPSSRRPERWIRTVQCSGFISEESPFPFSIIFQLRSSGNCKNAANPACF